MGKAWRLLRDTVGDWCQDGALRLRRAGRRLSAAHYVEEAEFPLPRPDTGRIEHAWAIHQAQRTVNFARRSGVAAWLLGGLNFQIEHHLFPRDLPRQLSGHGAGSGGHLSRMWREVVWSKNSIRGPGARPRLADRPRSEILPLGWGAMLEGRQGEGDGDGLEEAVGLHHRVGG